MTFFVFDFGSITYAQSSKNNDRKNSLAKNIDVGLPEGTDTALYEYVNPCFVNKAVDCSNSPTSESLKYASQLSGLALAYELRCKSYSFNVVSAVVVASKVLASNAAVANEFEEAKIFVRYDALFKSDVKLCKVWQGKFAQVSTYMNIRSRPSSLSVAKNETPGSSQQENPENIQGADTSDCKWSKLMRANQQVVCPNDSTTSPNSSPVSSVTSTPSNAPTSNRQSRNVCKMDIHITNNCIGLFKSIMSAGDDALQESQAKIREDVAESTCSNEEVKKIVQVATEAATKGAELAMSGSMKRQSDLMDICVRASLPY